LTISSAAPGVSPPSSTHCWPRPWDKFEQAINRIHRIVSSKEVHVWSIICDGTIERRLESDIHEKGDAAELVIDGKLLAEQQTEVNLTDLLAAAEKEFNLENETMDERALEVEWRDLRVSAGVALAIRLGSWPISPAA
jgi:hypothetical protein